MNSRRPRSSQSEIVWRGIVERKAASLPRYVVIPAKVLAPWGLAGTTVVEGEMNGTATGRRSLKRWDERGWFLDLPEKLCAAAGVDTGDEVTLCLRSGDDTLPEELVSLIANDPRAKQSWEVLTHSQRRMLREQVLNAKRPATRERRARRALLHRSSQSRTSDATARR